MVSPSGSEAEMAAPTAAPAGLFSAMERVMGTVSANRAPSSWTLIVAV